MGGSPLAERGRAGGRNPVQPRGSRGWEQVEKSAYRFINAVSDFATHSKPLRKTANYKENLFAKTVEGNPLIDKAYQMALAA